MYFFSAAFSVVVALLAACRTVRGQATDPICGDVASGSCPGKPFPGSSFTGAFCTSSATGVVTSVPGSLSLEGCAFACKFDNVFVRYINDGTCACVEYISNPNPIQDCSVANYAAYYHTPEAAASGLSRRRLPQKVGRGAGGQETLSFCAGGQTACRIDGTVDGYECLDTQTELESCGGCRFGALAARAYSPSLLAPAPPVERVGVDCSDVRRYGWGMTCRKGACVRQ